MAAGASFDVSFAMSIAALVLAKPKVADFVCLSFFLSLSFSLSFSFSFSSAFLIGEEIGGDSVLRPADSITLIRDPKIMKKSYYLVFAGNLLHSQTASAMIGRRSWRRQRCSMRHWKIRQV